MKILVAALMMCASFSAFAFTPVSFNGNQEITQAQPMWEPPCGPGELYPCTNVQEEMMPAWEPPCGPGELYPCPWPEHQPTRQPQWEPPCGPGELYPCTRIEE